MRFVVALSLLGLVACSGPVEPDSSTPAAQPNIVVIVSDDQGWKDVGYHGAEFPTPNIDRLAREGVELDRFYVTPICSPTRAGLLTGRYPLRYGLQRITVKRWGTRAIPESETLIPQGLAELGYGTRAMVGKWHVGWSKRAHHPMSRGFTSFYGLGGGAVGFFSHGQLGATDWHRDWEVLEEEGYATTLLGKEAARIITDAPADEPFFVYVAFNAIHTPNDAPEELIAQFAEIEDEDRRIKAAMSTSLDAEVGRILEALEAKGVADDTLVWYFSDNGGALPSGSENAPLRDGKWAVYEGGIRVNAAIRWPNGLEGGRKLVEPLSYIDVFPTLLEVAGAPAAGAGRFDGEPVWDVISGERSREDWVFHSYFRGQKIPQNVDLTAEVLFERNAVNADPWKLVRLGPDMQMVEDPREDAELELYRLAEDPYEERDVSEEHPEDVERLLGELKAFRALQKKPIERIDFRPPADYQPTSFAIPEE